MQNYRGWTITSNNNLPEQSKYIAEKGQVELRAANRVNIERKVDSQEDRFANVGYVAHQAIKN